MTKENVKYTNKGQRFSTIISAEDEEPLHLFIQQVFIKWYLKSMSQETNSRQRFASGSITGEYS